MKVSFLQTGGYAGLVLGTDLDAEELSTEEEAALRSLLRGWEEPATPAGAPALARDLETYEIRLEGDGPTRIMVFDRLSVPDGAAPLIDRLKREAGPRSLGAD